MESVRQFFALLFWYIDERNWRIQSTSSIIKPRKEPEDYRAGNRVVATFQGKPYRAIVISVKDQKEKLDDEKRKLDSFLQLPNLSPEEILEKMGLKGSLDYQRKESDTKDLDSNSRNGAQPKMRSLISKNDTKNGKKPKEQSSKPASASKHEDKKQKKAALDAARLVASWLLQNNVPNSVLQKQSDIFVNTHPLPTQTASTSSSIIETKQSPTSLVSQIQTFISTEGITLSQPLTTISPAFTSSQHFQQNTNMPDLTNHLTTTPLQFSQQLNSAYATDWDYQASSASECLANSLSSYKPVHTVQPTFDCSKCIPLINTLTNRVQVLEQQVELLLKSNLTYTSHQPLHSSHSPKTQQPQTVLMSLSTCPSTNDQSKADSSAVASSSSWSESEADAGCNSRVTVTTNEIDLVPGYGVKISIPLLDACVRKSKGSGTALARLLCDVFFKDEVMASSCVRGSKARTALDSADLFRKKDPSVRRTLCKPLIKSALMS